MSLEAVTTSIDDLSRSHIHEMLHLMQEYYENVFTDRFADDLSEKDWVILLLANGHLRGFSTLKLFEHRVAERRVQVIFSGDTVIDKDYWGSLALPVAWGQLMLSIVSEHPGHEVYWFLITKGYKTYRFLPVFFRRFYPHRTATLPTFEKALLRSLGQLQFGDRFDVHSYVGRAFEGGQRLRPGVADIDQSRRANADIAFFERVNPGHVRGDELACIARCHEENLTSFIVKRLKGP